MYVYIYTHIYIYIYMYRDRISENLILHIASDQYHNVGPHPPHLIREDILPLRRGMPMHAPTHHTLNWLGSDCCDSWLKTGWFCRRCRSPGIRALEL